jgi:hypothetical protein
MPRKVLNSKHTLYLFIYLFGILLTAGTVPAMPTNVLHGGDFEGLVSPLGEWMISSSTAGQTYGIGLVDIDGDGPLTASNAFMTMAGGAGGGGVTLSQYVGLEAGVSYYFGAQIASVTPAPNADGGTVTASIGIDSMLLASYDFGLVFTEPEYATLSGTFVPSTSGDYLLSIEVARMFQVSSASPTVYMDNVGLTYESTMQAVPVPSALVLGGIGILLVHRLRLGRNNERPVK